MYKLKGVFIVFLFMFFTSGCWDYYELNDMSIVTAIGIDLTENGYLITLQVANPSQIAGGESGNGGDEAATVTYEKEGRTIGEAIGNLMFQTPRIPYLGHKQILLVGDEAAKDGFYNILDYFMAHTQTKKIFPVVIVRNGKANDAIKILEPLEKNTALNIKGMLETTAINNSMISNRKLDEVLICLFTEGRHPSVSSIEITNITEKGEKTENISTSDPESMLIIRGSAVFIKDKVVGYLSDIDSLGHSIARGTVNTINITFPCDDKENFGTAIISRVKRKHETIIEKKEVKGKVNVKGDVAIVEYNCKLNIENPENIKKVEKQINKEIENIVSNTIKTLQEDLKSDIVGFGEYIYRYMYKDWKKYKDNWDEVFSKMDIEPKSEVKITSVASTKKVIKDVKNDGKEE